MPLVIRLLFILFFIQISSTNVIGQGWINTFGGPDTLNDYDFGLRIFEDHQGNLIHFGYLYSGGRYQNSSSIDSLLPIGSPGFFLEKLDKQGVKIWRHTVSGPTHYWLTEIDNLGNFYIVGRLGSKMVFYSPSRTDSLIPHASITSWPGGSFILKLNPQGDFIWAKQVPVLYSAIAISPNNDLLLGGKAFGQTDIDPGLGTNIINGNPTYGSAFICQFKNPGAFDWGMAYSNSSATIRQFCFDNKENTYLSGQYTNNNGGSDYDVFISKMDSSRSILWSKSFGGTSRDNLISMGLDSKNNVLLGGEYGGAVDFDPNSGSHVITSKSSKGIYLLKLTSDGIFKQVHSIEGHGVRLYSLKVTKNDMVLACGAFGDTLKIVGNSMINNRITLGQSDLFYTVQDTNGVYVGSDTYGGLEGTGARDVHMDDQNQIFLTGSYGGSVNFHLFPGSIPNNSYGRYDGFVLKVGMKITEVSNLHFASNNELQLFPNPSSGIINLRSEQSTAQIEVYDLQGRRLQLIQQPAKQIELPEQSGIYFVRIRLESGELLSRKVVRE